MLDGLQEVGDGALVGWDDAVDERAGALGVARDEDLFVEAGSGGGDVRQSAQAREQRTPVADAVAGDAHQQDVRSGTDEALLQVAAHSVGDGQRNDERGHARSHAYDGDGGDNADHGLSPLGPQIPRRNEEFKSHPYLSVLSSRDEMHQWMSQMQGVADAKKRGGAEALPHFLPVTHIS